MAHQEQDRVWYRHFVGFSAIYLQAEPRVESAITATQSIADGGSRPDSSTENYMKGLVYGSASVAGPLVVPGGTTQNMPFAMPATTGLIAVEQQLLALQPISFVSGKQDEATVDPVRGAALLRREGRRLAHALARMIGMKGVRADIFSPAPVIRDDDVFSNDNYSRDPWRSNWPGPIPR